MFIIKLYLFIFYSKSLSVLIKSLQMERNICFYFVYLGLASKITDESNFEMSEFYFYFRKTKSELVCYVIWNRKRFFLFMLKVMLFYFTGWYKRYLTIFLNVASFLLYCIFFLVNKRIDIFDEIVID